MGAVTSKKPIGADTLFHQHRPNFRIRNRDTNLYQLPIALLELIEGEVGDSVALGAAPQVVVAPENVFCKNSTFSTDIEHLDFIIDFIRRLQRKSEK